MPPSSMEQSLSSSSQCCSSPMPETTTTRLTNNNDPLQLSLPMRPYGRDKEIRLLLEAYERSKRQSAVAAGATDHHQEGHEKEREETNSCHSNNRWTPHQSHSSAASTSSSSSFATASPAVVASAAFATTPSVSVSLGAAACPSASSLTRSSHIQDLVLLCGASGTGKTALAQSLRHKVEVEDGGFLLVGKFDWATTRQDPYAVFVAAMTQLTQDLVSREQQTANHEDNADDSDNDDHDADDDDKQSHSQVEEREEEVEEDAAAVISQNGGGYSCCNGGFVCSKEEEEKCYNNTKKNKKVQSSLLERLRRVLQEAVGAEGRVLTDYIPALKQILEPSSQSSSSMPSQDNENIKDDAKRDAENDDINEIHTSSMVSRSSLTGTEALRRFQFVFCKLCRAIATVVPLVLFLDDLQWSDQASLDLIQAVLMTTATTTTTTTATTSSGETLIAPQTPSLLVIGAYRPFDSSSSSSSSRTQSRNISNGQFMDALPFQEHLKNHWLVVGAKDSFAPTTSTTPTSTTPTTSTTGNNNNLRLTKIKLGNLTQAAVHDMVAATLQLSPESTAALAQVVHAKSNGNAFRALQYLRLLSHQQKQQQQHRRDSNQRENNPQLLKIQDDDERLKQQPHHGLLEEEDDEETADDLVCRILQTLPPLTLEVLKVASCMRDEIDPTVMAIVLENGKATCDIAQALDVAVNEGILSSCTPEQGRYRFIHDRIRHAAFSFVENPDALSLRIGRKLCQELCSVTLTASIFTVVNLLNKGIDLITDQDERYKVAELNLEAGLRASSLAAFPDAAQYLEMGMALCNSSKNSNNNKSWEERYKLTLSLCNGAADAELCNQHYDRVGEITHQVFQHARNLRDKLPSYITQINAAGQSGKVHEAIAMGFDVLDQLGEPFPNKPSTFVILKDLIKTKVMIRGRSNENLLSLKPMVDETKLAAIHVMNILIPYAVQSASPQLVLLGTRLVQVCLSFGLSKACSVGFNTYGWVLCHNDRKQGYRFGLLALSIVEKLRAREMIPRVHSIFYFWNCHWMRPLRETLEPLRHAYNVGMDIGDTEYGLHAAMFRCFHALFCGLPLPLVSEMFLDTMEKLRHFKLEILLQCTNVRFQFVTALMGNASSGNDSSSNGDLLQRFAIDEPDNKLIALLHYSCGATLANLLGDVELAEALVEKRLALKFELFAEFFYALDQFQHGLIAIARARSGVDKQGNIKTARGVIKMMSIWARDCPFNFLSKKKLLQAELQSLHCKKSACQKIHRLYGQAFQLASEQGLTHEAALACELAGDFMDRHGEDHLATTYWNKSYALYLEWGAIAKAAQLECRTQKPTTTA